MYLLPVILLMILPTGRLNGNEEQYYQLGYRLVAPHAFSPHSATFDHSHARVLSYGIMGVAVAAFGYEGALFALRFLNALLYALGVAWLFSALRLSIVDSTLALAVFWLAREDLFGGEWLFRGAEPKTLAYALVLLAFGFVLRNRWRSALASFVVATYLHFQVGGFWTAAALLFQWLSTREFRPVVTTALTYAALTAPLAVVIGLDQLGGRAAAVAGPSIDSLYSIRVEASPFVSKGMLWSWSTPVVAGVGLMAAAAMFLRRSQGRSRHLLVLVLCLLGYLFIALVVSALDRKAHVFGKFYLFRPASLTLLLVIVALLYAVNEWRDDALTLIKRATAVAVIPVFLWSATKGKVDEIRSRKLPRQEIQELKKYIHARSRPDQIVLIEPTHKLDVIPVALPRLLERPTLVSWKFVPTHPQDIQHWYHLLQYVETLFAQGCREPLKFDVAFLLVLSESSLPAVQNCGEVAFRSPRFALIRIADR